MSECLFGKRSYHLQSWRLDRSKLEAPLLQFFTIELMRCVRCRLVAKDEQSWCQVQCDVATHYTFYLFLQYIYSSFGHFWTLTKLPWGVRRKTMKFDDFMKKHGYPSIYSLQKNKVNNPLIVRGQFDVLCGTWKDPKVGPIDGQYHLWVTHRIGPAL